MKTNSQITDEIEQWELETQHFDYDIYDDGYILACHVVGNLRVLAALPPGKRDERVKLWLQYHEDYRSYGDDREDRRFDAYYQVWHWYMFD